MSQVAVVDYGMGNLDSVARAVEECGGEPIVTREPRDFSTATHIILPGVGAYSVGMQNIRELGLDEILGEQVIDNGIPLLGICLGMQLLSIRGWEGGETSWLGWIEGEVRLLEPNGPDIRIPHVGWNEVVYVRPSPLFDGIPMGKDFYFVHSYHFHCADETDIIATTDYAGGFISAVSRRNVWGVQFHPEKSQKLGFQVIKNFLGFQGRQC